MHATILMPPALPHQPDVTCYLKPPPATRPPASCLQPLSLTHLTFRHCSPSIPAAFLQPLFPAASPAWVCSAPALPFLQLPTRGWQGGQPENTIVGKVGGLPWTTADFKLPLFTWEEELYKNLQ